MANTFDSRYVLFTIDPERNRRAETIPKLEGEDEAAYRSRAQDVGGTVLDTLPKGSLVNILPCPADAVPERYVEVPTDLISGQSA